ASLNHPNIVKAFDVDKQIEGGAEIHFLVMEYVCGKNLGKMVQEQGPLEYIAAVDYIRQGADGLQHAHEAGLVHRDIKPENLLIDEAGSVKLLDLGLARFFNASDEESLTIKHDEKVLGTADFLAPEQAIDSHKVDLRADIYSLGCTLYYALTGHPPFTDGSLVQRLLAHQTRRPPSIKYDRPDAPEDLLAIIEKMMAKKAGERYQTAGEVADVLGRWLVQHGGNVWRETHPALVAKFAGMEAIARPVAAASSAPPTAAPEPAPVAFASPQLASTEEQPRVVAPPRPAVDVATSPEPMRPEPVVPKPARDSVKAAGPSRTGTDSHRRPAPRHSQAMPVVAVRKPWDWEKTLAIGLLTLGTAVVIMIGVWLFGVNQQTTASNDVPNPTAAQTSELTGTPRPQ
ncbi:MAG TPA: serine/threonine-protein kinase, partial [Planctomycetaceae bacterium]|nr:serine/threonine-protein kinase [Planctomycetaceae bacterium]